MDISGMSEEEQLQAAMQLSLQDANTVMGRTPGGQTGAANPQAQPLRPDDRGKPRSFPLKDSQDASAPLSAKKQRGESTAEPAGTAFRLSTDEVRELMQLIFGDRPEVVDVERWFSVGFQFSRIDGTEWGLWQRHGGPCGVFAPVQALILRQLLFSEASGDNAVSDPLKVRPDQEDLRGPTLAVALASVLYHATPTSSYAICQVALPPGDSDTNASSASVAATNFVASGGSSLEVSGRRVSRVSDVQQIFEEGVDTWLAGPCGVLSFICSVLVSRTMMGIREDMDDPTTPMIGRFGHCSQELVNLMLIGEATSNVFDGSRWLGDDPSSGLLVKGVDGDKIGVPTIGFLSELEPMRYLSVGSLFKNPDFPIWVLGSSTHYTILFSTRRSDSQLSAEAQLEQKAKKVFSENSIDEGGLAMSTSLSKLLEGLGINADRLPQAMTELVHEDIILWDDFRNWARRQFGLAEGPPGSEANSQSARIQLFLYDGQDPPGPTLRSVSVEASDIDPSLAGAETDAFTATLQTRWPNCVVSVRAIAGAGTEAM